MPACQVEDGILRETGPILPWEPKGLALTPVWCGTSVPPPTGTGISAPGSATYCSRAPFPDVLEARMAFLLQYFLLTHLSLPRAGRAERPKAQTPGVHLLPVFPASCSPPANKLQRIEEVKRSGTQAGSLGPSPSIRTVTMEASGTRKRDQYRQEHRESLRGTQKPEAEVQKSREIPKVAEKETETKAERGRKEKTGAEIQKETELKVRQVGQQKQKKGEEERERERN